MAIWAIVVTGGLLSVTAAAVGAAPGDVSPDHSRPSGAVGGLSVSHADPPPTLVLTPYARLDIPVPQDVAADLPQAAVLADGGVVLVDVRSQKAYLVGRDGSTSGAIQLDVTPSSIVATPGPVVYGLAADAAIAGLTAYAIALSGPQAGRVLATTSVPDAPSYLELPVGALGNSPSGVVDRTRVPGRVLIEHFDVTGAPTAVSGLREVVTIDQNDVVVDQGNGRQWPLVITRHPDAAEPPAGESPPAPSAEGAVVYWTTIGPPSNPTDQSSANTLPVVAVLEADGGGAWYSIPFGWKLVGSDTGGTVFARRTGSIVELARLDASQIDPCADYEPNDRYPVRLCDSGPAVRVVQERLGGAGIEVQIDGYFGPATEAAVREFQRRNGLEVDGLVGPDTWRSLTGGTAAGTDADGNGVVDPWELGQPSAPTPPSPGFPPANANLTQGGETWAVVLAASADMEDPALQEARLAAEGAGYAAGPTDCDRGAAAALGVSGEIVFTVSVYFATEAEARSAQAGFASRGVPGVAALVTTFCLD